MVKINKSEVVKQSTDIVKKAVNQAVKETKIKEESKKRAKKRISQEHHGYPRKK